MTQDQALANQANAWGHASGPQQTLAQFLSTGPHTTPTGATIPRQVVTPQPAVTGSVTLSATAATTLTTSDHRFTIDVPAGALTSSQLASVGGPVTLQVTEVAGPVGGGASGRLSLGVYQIELLGPHGRLTGFAFHHPLKLGLHYDPTEAAGFINYGVTLQVESDTPQRTKGVVTPGGGSAPTGQPTRERVPITLSASAHTVSGQSLLSTLPLTGSAVATFNTSAPQATWPTVQDFQTNLNSGSLSYSYPINLPPAPGSFVPSLGLSYASDSVNEDHGLQTSAPWVGEGWSLDLGSINWSQVDENSGCQQAAPPPPYNPNCGSHNWQNTWTISAGGIGGPLVPQNINWATGTNAAGDPVVSPPVQWFTAPESHAKIWMINCTTTDLQNNAWTHPCWRVWLPSGEMMEFGATNDSVEYYLDASSNKYIYSWKVDALVDPHGNQIHISYQQYTGNYPSTNVPYVRDAELANVSYDSPTCQNTSTICPTTGSAPNLWQPLVQVVFDQGTKPTRLTAADTPCTNWSSTSSRCDTAPDYSGGLPGPQVTSLGILNAIEVQVQPTSGSGWHVLRAYAFSYEQGSYFSGLVDAISGWPEYGAGYTDLTKIQEFGADWTGNTSNTGTSWPAMIYSYTGHWSSTTSCTSPGNFPCTDSATLQEHYIDPVYTSALTLSGASQCIPWVNSGGCYRYAYSETLNQRYLTEADNGMGWQETFSWQEGHMNVVGVPNGRSITSPFSCTASDYNAFPCWEVDEQHWSRILLVARDANVKSSSGGATITVDHHFAYTYTLTSVQSGNNWCISGVCTVIWDFGNVNDGDYLDYYNSEYRGFSQVHVLEQEIDTGGGSCTTACTIAQEDHYFITTQGWGVWNQNEVTTKQGCWNAEGTNPVQYLCPTSPYWSSSNMPASRETQVDQWASNGTTLLKRTLTTYALDCGPVGDPATPSPSQFDSNWWTINPGINNTHLLVAELDQSNPVAVCDPQVASVQTLMADGGSLSTAPTTTVTYSYDTNQSYSATHDYGNVTVVDTVASDGGNVGGSGNDIVQTTDYTVNDNITTTATSATGTYIVNTAYQKATRSGSASGTIQALTQDYYDGNTSLTAAPTKGDVTQTSVAYSGAGPYNFLVTKDGYDSYGNLAGILSPNGQTGCMVASVSYSSCATYDTSSYTAHITQVTNALGQNSLMAYGSSATFGYGEWMQSETDPNSQTTTYQYDALGHLTSITKPGEGTGLLTTQFVYTIWCSSTGPSTPCSELDTIQRYDSSTTVTSRTFYDGWGKAAETRVSADSSHDVVTYSSYDAREEVTFTSRPYYVTSYTGNPGSAAYSAPDSTQLGSSAVFDALGRQTQATDPAGASTTTSYLQVTGPDSAPYEGTQEIDANQHKHLILADALGRTRYTQTFTGNNTYTLYSTTGDTYDFQGNVLMLTHPDGTHMTSFTYDLAGRKTGVTDPDLGSMSYVLDTDGNTVQQTDARGQIVYMGYDALDRPLWRNTTNSPSGAYVAYSYDGTVPTGVSCSGITPGSNAIGHVTTEQFKSGPSNSFSGAYCYSYDQRGERIGQVDTLAGTAYLPVFWTYNDAGVVTKLTYPTQEYEQYNFSSQERLISVTRSARGTTNYLIPSITYNNAAGAAGKPDSYVVTGTGACSQPNGSTVCASLTYDNDFRLTHATYTHPTGTLITYYDMGVTYDAVGNVTSVSSTLPAVGSLSGGQDNQQFCYDEQNRLTWAGNTGTNPCTNQAVTGTTLANEPYTASYTYDSSNRITASTLTGTLAGSPQGGYTYDSTHYHAVDAIGSSSYEAQYDASGNMTCRTPTSANVCTSTSQTGAKFTYDAEDHLIQWVSADGATTVNYGYDGEGNRFEMQVISGGTTTTTSYISNLEEVQSVSGGSTTKIVYFYFMGQQVSEDDNTHWYYPIGDQVTSTTVVVDFSGVIAVQLFGPYGQTRWSGGTMPTSYAFTGQRADSATGLDYYNTRYYDPAADTFTSPDSALGKGAGLNRYGYVAGNPETLTDPTGHIWQNPCRFAPEDCYAIQHGQPEPTAGMPSPCMGDGAYSCTPYKHFHHPSKGKSLLQNAGVSTTNEYAAVGLKGLDKLQYYLERMGGWLKDRIDDGYHVSRSDLSGLGQFLEALGSMFTFSSATPLVASGFTFFIVGAGLSFQDDGLSPPAGFLGKADVDAFITSIETQVLDPIRETLEQHPDKAAKQAFILEENDTYQEKDGWYDVPGQYSGRWPQVQHYTPDYDMPLTASFTLVTYQIGGNDQTTTSLGG